MAEEQTPANVASNDSNGSNPERLVTVEREGSGACLVFLAQTRNASEVVELEELFEELKAGCRVRALSRGPVMAAVLRVREDADGEATAELMSLLETIGERYRYSKVELGLPPALNRLIEDMGLDTGSELFPSPHCSLCGRPAPFPTRIVVRGIDRETEEGLYCDRCIARTAEPEEKDGVRALLRIDRETFSENDPADLRPLPSRKKDRSRYRFHPPAPLAATG